MKTSELLIAFANYLENSNNEIISLAEDDEDHLVKVALACVEAASILRETAEDISTTELVSEPAITADSLEGLAAIATMFDSTNDPELIKQANVIDALIHNFVLTAEDVNKGKTAEAKKVQKMKDLYEATNKFDDKKEAIEKTYNDSPMTKQYRPLEAPLSTRHCPDHPGTSLARVEDHVWQCNLDKKLYDFNSGFTTMNGDRIPGGGVEFQTGGERPIFESSFTTRENHRK